MVEENAFVTPGEKIATEEEFASGNNTYVEEGVVYSAVIGNVVKTDGAVGVTTAGREIKIIGRDMLVIGVVTDDMKNVMFVKLDDINIEKKDYLALKDGKIVEVGTHKELMNKKGLFHKLITMQAEFSRQASKAKAL